MRVLLMPATAAKKFRRVAPLGDRHESGDFDFDLRTLIDQP